MSINDPPTQRIYTTMNSNVSRRDFIKYTAGTFACVSLGTLTYGCGSSRGSNTTISGYPIDANVSTTLQKTVKLDTTFSGTIQPKDLKQIPLYDQYGYGVWTRPLEKMNDWIWNEHVMRNKRN